MKYSYYHVVAPCDGGNTERQIFRSAMSVAVHRSPRLHIHGIFRCTKPITEKQFRRLLDFQAVPAENIAGIKVQNLEAWDRYIDKNAELLDFIPERVLIV